MWSMLQVLGELDHICSGHDESDIHSDIALQRAVERCLEIIGELANKVSKETQDLHPTINWAGIINQRHVIAHTYDGINYDLLWIIISKHAPILRDQLKVILPQEPEDPLPENTQ